MAVNCWSPFFCFWGCGGGDWIMMNNNMTKAVGYEGMLLRGTVGMLLSGTLVYY